MKTELVLPTNKYNLKPTVPTKIKLHGLDLLSPAIQIHNHRFFKNVINNNNHNKNYTIQFEEFVNKLKLSLSETLELYTPVTGSILNGEILLDQDHIKPTPFIIDIKDDNTPFIKDYEELSPRTEVILDPSSSILAVKVTKFSCNTICVASSFNHQASDLRGFLDFLELWAQITRGEKVDLNKIPNDWNRNPGRYFKEFKLIDSKSTIPPPFKLLPSPSIGPPEYFLRPSEITRWRITKQLMEQLKNDYSPVPVTSDTWISSGDALTTLICSVITRARFNSNIPRLGGRSSEESNLENIAMAADGRERSNNGEMQGKYFGNFNNLWSKQISRFDLLDTSIDAGKRVSMELRNGLIDSLSPKSISNRISFFEKNIEIQNRINWTADIILTNWCKFDLKGPKLNFGYGNLFDGTSGGVSILPPGYSIIQHDKESGDFYLLITIEIDASNSLKNDIVLNKYGTILP